MPIITQIIVILLTLIFWVPAEVASQQRDSLSATIPIRYIRLPQHVSIPDCTKNLAIEDQVALTLLEAKHRLGLYGLMVGILADSSSMKSVSGASKFDVLELEQLVAASQAIVIKTASLSQDAIPVSPEPNYFSIGKSIRTGSKAERQSAIQTRLSVNAQIVDVVTGEPLAPLMLDIWATGRSAKKARDNAMKRLKENAILELRRLYWLSSELTLNKGGNNAIAVGTLAGVGRGATFELVEPDRIWESDGEEWLVPGGIAAIAAVSDTSADTSSVKILRQWRDIYPEAWAVERIKPIYGLSINFSPTTIGSYVNFSLCFHVAPMSRYDLGLAIQVIKITDSYQEDDYGFGLAGFGIWRFINSPKIDCRARINLDLDFPFKRDDLGNSVNIILFSSTFSVIGEWLVTKRIDFTLQLGYRLGISNDNWQYSEDDMEISAYWKKAAPVVNNSGMMMSAGFRYLLF